MIALLATTAFAQNLVLNGSCPGPMSAGITGMTPNGSFAVVTGSQGGTTPVPAGACRGTRMDVANGALRMVDQANAQGVAILQANVPGAVCGQFVQVLDLTTCAKTPAVQIGGPACAGDLMDPGNGVTGCWYTASAVGLTCESVCSTHGGFDVVASQHSGNAVGMYFWPGKVNGSNWETVECSSTDNNTNWGANGAAPNPLFSHAYCYVNCACNN